MRSVPNQAKGAGRLRIGSESSSRNSSSTDTASAKQRRRCRGLWVHGLHTNSSKMLSLTRMPHQLRENQALRPCGRFPELLKATQDQPTREPRCCGTASPCSAGHCFASQIHEIFAARPCVPKSVVAELPQSRDLHFLDNQRSVKQLTTLSRFAPLKSAITTSIWRQEGVHGTETRTS
jgi:hypothetical protein